VRMQSSDRRPLTESAIGFGRLLPLVVIAAVTGLVTLAARSPVPLAGGSLRLPAGGPGSEGSPQGGIDAPLAGCGKTACTIAWMRSRQPGCRENRRFSCLEKVPEDFVHGQRARLDGLLEAGWRQAGVVPAAAVEDLLVLRRAWLAAAGTIPSLEEIRRFEADSRPDRLDRWLDAILDDRRSAEHLARVLARSLVGSDQGPFLVFRRDRFLAWLSDSLHSRRPFDEIVREMLAADGLWTGEPAVNFITQAVAGGRVDPVKLAGRVSRGFLGQRIDCAECHDHPFAPVTQAQFEGLAACFAQARLSALGVEDDPRMVFTVETPPAMNAGGDEGAGVPSQGAARRVPPVPPFAPEWMPESGTRRERLAEWLVHPANRRFERAVANRAWQIAFGRPWHDPVDDLPDPPRGDGPGGRDPTDLMDLLGEEFRDGECDLLALLRLLFDTRIFRLSSAHPARDDPDRCDAVAGAWAAFPLSRLPADALVGAMLQATQLETIDGESHLLTRAIRFFRQADFVREYGEPGDGQAANEPVTIPQALVRMNGRLVREMVEANAFTASGRIAGMAADDDSRIEAAFLCCLSRRPTPAERTAVLPLLRQTAQTGRGMEDLFWTLFNAAEFSWNH
jgi:hypothetical protein